MMSSTASKTRSGRLANAIDAWVATELRRAGFPADEVWPRLTKPRVLPREVGLFVQGLPKKLRSDIEAQLVRNATVAPRDAKVLGRAYVKQVDVVIAQWSRGPELNDVTPPDLQADQFLAVMIEAVLDRTPVEAHVEVRERHEHRTLPVRELSEEDDDPSD
jgi:hypothetical protein